MTLAVDVNGRGAITQARPTVNSASQADAASDARLVGCAVDRMRGARLPPARASRQLFLSVRFRDQTDPG